MKSKHKTENRAKCPGCHRMSMTPRGAYGSEGYVRQKCTNLHCGRTTYAKPKPQRSEESDIG